MVGPAIPATADGALIRSVGSSNYRVESILVDRGDNRYFVFKRKMAKATAERMPIVC